MSGRPMAGLSRPSRGNATAGTVWAFRVFRAQNANIFHQLSVPLLPRPASAPPRVLGAPRARAGPSVSSGAGPKQGAAGRVARRGRDGLAVPRAPPRGGGVATLLRQPFLPRPAPARWGKLSVALHACVPPVRPDTSCLPVLGPGPCSAPKQNPASAARVRASISRLLGWRWYSRHFGRRHARRLFQRDAAQGSV